MRKSLFRTLALALCLAAGAGAVRAQQPSPAAALPAAGEAAATDTAGTSAPADAALTTDPADAAFTDAPADAALAPAPAETAVEAAPAPHSADAPAAAAALSGEVPAPAEVRPLTINEMRRQRGLTDMHNLFVPKGQWIFGGTASYSTHTNDRYQFLIIEDIDSKGYTVRVSPMIAYALRDNTAIGARFIYARSLLKLDNAHLKFGDDADATELRAKNFYTLTHSYTAAVIWRQYIPLGSSKRFALFNEMQLSGGSSQARFTNDSPVKGTYQTGYSLSLGFAPGIVAFATNNMAVEVNVGVMGISYNHIKQVHNQVQEGKLDTSMMNFKVNIFSIGLGMAFYL